MSSLRLNKVNKQFIHRLTECRCLSTALPKEEEYTTSPQYPPVLDLSREKVVERKKEAEYEELKRVKTVEEKQIKLNMPKYYGFKCYILQEDYIPYNSLTLVQHVTRTHLIRTNTLPAFYNNIDVSSLAESMRSQLEEVILFELDHYRQINDLKKEELDKVQRDNFISSNLSQQLNRIIINNLRSRYHHMCDLQVDINSRFESFWYAGGMNPPECIRRSKQGVEWLKNDMDGPTDRLINYMGSANVALRSDKPLKPIISEKEAENSDLNVPVYKLDPRAVGTKTTYKHIANVPGFWPGDPKEFGVLSYHKRGHILSRHYNDPEDDKDALYRQGILTGFGWLNAQANYLGFNSFNDVTYPLVTQSIITNGQLWTFCVYQLNTIMNHSKYINENPKRNICWATSDLKLYQNIEEGTKLVGFNDDVLHILLKLYANIPEERLGVNMKPYLSREEKCCANYEDDDKREWLEREYKFLTSNRPRLKLDHEIYAWEKIYKIDNETRFMDKKRRAFEFKINPWNRKLDDRQARYIPRVLRPDLPRWKGRYAKEYFP